MKKTIFILAALAFIFASCSNSAGSGSDSNNYVSNGTGGGNSGGEEQQQGGGNGGGSQSEPTVTGVDFTAVNNAMTINVGDVVKIADSMSSRTIIRVESKDSSIASVSGSQSGGFFITGVSGGQTNVNAYFDQTNHFFTCDVTVLGSSSGQSQSSLESFLTGSWTHSDSSYQSSGTLTLNANKTGHITTYLRGGLLHNKDLTWRAYEARDARNQPVKVLEISGTGEGALDNAHTITTAANSFTLKGNFAFGMSNQTVWTKQ